MLKCAGEQASLERRSRKGEARQEEARQEAKDEKKHEGAPSSSKAFSGSSYIEQLNSLRCRGDSLVQRVDLKARLEKAIGNCVKLS